MDIAVLTLNLVVVVRSKAYFLFLLPTCSVRCGPSRSSECSCVCSVENYQEPARVRCNKTQGVFW